MRSGGFSNQARILRGAFVEFGISQPPLIAVFQFNPLMITRTRTATVNPPSTPAGTQPTQNLGFAQQFANGLLDIRLGQTITVKQETLSFDIRLDATDKLNDGDVMTEQFGIAPQLSTLELMMLPKNQSLLGGASLGNGPMEFAFFDKAKNPPIILFVWGRKKVLPINITSMSIKEEEFSTELNPTRATVSVSVEVIEGPNAPFLYTKSLKEVMSGLNLANIGNITNTIVPA